MKTPVTVTRRREFLDPDEARKVRILSRNAAMESAKRYSLERQSLLKNRAKLKASFDTRTSNCLARTGIMNRDDIRQRCDSEGIGWLNDIQGLGEKSKTKILQSIGYEYRKPTPIDKAIERLKLAGYTVTPPD
mgnify:CR=1 FL=1